MEIKIDNLLINYDVCGEGENIILLHGWGQNIQIFDCLIKDLSSNFRVWRIDLPGFGLSEEPKNILSVLDYTKILRQFIIECTIMNPILIGHSFGGRIAIKYASIYDIDKIVLVNSAGIRNRLSASKKAKIFAYKTCKKLGIKLKMGSSDYQKASPMMKGILSKVVNEDLSVDMQSIRAKTLLIWGEKDDVTKLSDGYLMEKLIKNSGLVVIPNAGHFSFLERSQYFLIVLNSFLMANDEHD